MLNNKIIYSIVRTLDSLFSPQVSEAVSLLRTGENATLEELQSFRTQALINLIQYAYDHVPYYREKFIAMGLGPDRIKSLEDIKDFPILTKENIRSAGKILRSDNIDQMNVIVSRSGGTTGEPIASYVDRRAQALGTYAYLRGLEWMGWKPGVPMITLFGGSLQRPTVHSLRTRVRDYSLGEIFLPAFELNRENAASYLQTIRNNSPCTIKGYASALYNLALYAHELNNQNFEILGIFSTAEYLPDHWAEKISHVFNCPIKCYYGCGEINSLGFQIESSGPYVVPDEHVLIESVDLSTQGALRKNTLLVTDLFNYAQPLIRYELGDIGEVSQPGLFHPTRSTITNLIGRSSDMFIRKDGTTVSPSLAPHIISKTKLPVIKYQFIQVDLNHIRFLYETEYDDLSDTQKMEVTSIVKSHISNEIHLEFIRTKDFVLSKNGKFRIVIVEFE